MVGNCRPSSRTNSRTSAMSGTTEPSLAYSPGCGVRTTLPRRGQARAAQEAEEIRFADVEPLLFEGGADVGQGGPLAAKRAGSLVDRIAFRGRLAAGPGGGEERVDVGVASEVADDGSYGVGVKMKPLGDFIGGCGFVEVGAADLVVPVGR